MKEKVFITGAGGFVGAYVARNLMQHNFDIHTLTHSSRIPWRLKDISKKVSIHKADLSDLKRLQKFLKVIQPNHILHFAAYGAYYYQDDLNKCIEANILGTKNLLEASKNIPYKSFIYSGSSSEYGFKNTPIKEEDSCNPTSYYAASKLAASNICKLFSQVNNKPIIILRLFSVYGPYEEPTRFVPTVIKSLINKNKIKLTPGKQRRDFIYVEDVMAAVRSAMSLGGELSGEIFNIGSGKEYTNDEVVSALFRITKDRTTIDKGAYPKRSWDTSHWVADISKANKILKWEPKFSLEEGLLDNYKWLNQNLNLYK